MLTNSGRILQEDFYFRDVLDEMISLRSVNFFTDRLLRSFSSPKRGASMIGMIFQMWLGSVFLFFTITFPQTRCFLTS